MEDAKPTRKPRPARKPKAKPVEKAEHLQPEQPPEEIKEFKMSDKKYLQNQLPDKYKKKGKVGTPTLGRPTGYVSEIGLGNLRSITAYDDTNLST